MKANVRHWRSAVAVAGMVWGLMLSATVGSALPPVRVDDDRDGIDDALEQLLAEIYAPVIFMEPGESNYPVNVNWILQRSELWYGEQGCTPDENRLLLSVIFNQSNLLGPQGASGSPWIHPGSFGPDEPVTLCNDPARPLSTTEPSPDGFGNDQLWFLNDLQDSLRVGALDPRDWVTYFHVYPTADGGVMIQYWHTFAFNQFAAFDAHGGDWDASIQVQLGSDLRLEGIWFSRHKDDHPGTFMPCPDMQCSNLSFHQDTHPVMTIDGGGHAAFASPLDHCIDTHTAVIQTGTVVWTDTPDDPASLREVESGFVCDPVTNQCHLICHLSDPVGGTVWKSWSAGDVRQAGPVDHSIAPNPSSHGGLINLGEYNPGFHQASRLLQGQFHPLNGQDFIKYSGRWGTTNTLASDGPRGPVFQGFSGGTYTAWYNQGSDFPADPTTSPWRAEPSTSLHVGSPSFVAVNGATFVSGTTPLTLTATESAVATRFGSIVTSYRLFPVLSSAGPFATYSAPFTLSGADGTYALNYFSLDGLNNEESLRAQVLSLDGTPPTVSISSPVATQYAHSGTLVLNYTANDFGSGVNSVTPSMDGSGTVAGHGLQPGQAINLLTELALGPHTFTVAAADNLQNAGSSSVTFEVIVTPQSIKDDVGQFFAAGAIKNRGQANSLLSKLDAAAKARASGRCTTASNIYHAFVNELQAQSGKGVDPAAATIMIGDAQYLIAHCP